MSNLPEDTVEQPRRPRSPWSFQIATVSGIPVRIHFTFLLLLVWVFLTGGKSLPMVLLVLLIFLCVVLHEFGHALVAKRYDVQTRDITLYPMGGVALLQGRPKPAQEFWIALAGPAVNILLAVIFAAISFIAERRAPEFLLTGIGPGANLIDGLYSANVLLPVFNLIPAFPMDGGRVLRAALAMKMPEARATQIAGTLGQFLAILFAFAGLIYTQPLWLVVAFFVFLGASQEVQATVGLSLVAGRKVREGMQTRFRVIPSGASMEEAAQMLLAGSQHDFPVVAGEEVIGVLSGRDIARGLAAEGSSGYVAAHMSREFLRLDPEAPLESAFDALSEADGTPLMVMDGDRLVGMLTSENMSEFIMLEHAKSQRQSPRRD